MTGRNLDGEGNVIEIGANPLDQREIIRARLKPSVEQSAPFHEQPDRRGVAGAVRCTGIQRGDLIEGLTLHPKRAPAGVDWHHPVSGNPAVRWPNRHCAETPKSHTRYRDHARGISTGTAWSEACLDRRIA